MLEAGMASKGSRRMIRLHDDERVAGNGDDDDDDARSERARRMEREDEALLHLARELMYRKIRPEVCHGDAASHLARWLRPMLLGPAMPLNKEEKFVEDILASTELVADAEIYLETLPGMSTTDFVRRNRADVAKRDAYPDPASSLRVREGVLRNKCVAMVGHLADSRDVSDAIARERAVEHFYDFYMEAITIGHLPSYNSYTGMTAMMNPTFLKQSEDVVMYGLGLTSARPSGLVACERAPPPYHALFVFALATSICLRCLPSLESVD